MAQHRVMRKDLVNNTVRSVYESTDLDDANLHLERNFHTAHVENGKAVEEYYVEEGDEE